MKAVQSLHVQLKDVSMDARELQELLNYIKDNHTQDTVKPRHKAVKYVHPAIDMQYQKCFAITINTKGWCKRFVDEESSEDSLFDRIVSFLQTSSAGIRKDSVKTALQSLQNYQSTPA